MNYNKRQYKRIIYDPQQALIKFSSMSGKLSKE